MTTFDLHNHASVRPFHNLPSLHVFIGFLSGIRFGRTSGVVDVVTGEPIGGLFGTAVATMGMLSTAAYVLTMDIFGPITVNTPPPPPPHPHTSERDSLS
jgi:hypothetical protein